MNNLMSELEAVVDELRCGDCNDSECLAMANRLTRVYDDIAAAVRDAERWRQFVAGIDAEQVVAASEKHGDALGVLKDAARYRWIRDSCGIIQYYAITNPILPSGDKLDAAIDAASQTRGEG